MRPQPSQLISCARKRDVRWFEGDSDRTSRLRRHGSQAGVGFGEVVGGRARDGEADDPESSSTDAGECDRLRRGAGVHLHGPEAEAAGAERGHRIASPRIGSTSVGHTRRVPNAADVLLGSKGRA